jgi:hypothetical protein
MKGTIIGTDLLEFNNSVKILEINTNATIFNSATDLLDYTSFFEMLGNNNITELHFVYNDEESHIKDTDSTSFLFEERLKTKCAENGITYFDYKVPKNSVTVPYVEDADNKFILRQAFDTTALVDETYCADKFEFFNLMKDSEYIPKTYINNGGELSFDTFNTISNYTNGSPNFVKKDRYPNYDTGLYPSLSKLSTDTELNQLKTSVDNTTFLVQEFIYDDANIVNNRWNIIRSVDILYGGELDVINMGSYKTSTFVDIDMWNDEYEADEITLTKKSRYKWVNKGTDTMIGTEFNYHANSESLILGNDGTLISLNDLVIGNPISSVNFTDVDGISPNSYDSDSLRTPLIRRWSSTISQSQSTLTTEPSNVIGITSASISEIMLKITLENGTYWNEFKNTEFLIQAANSNIHYFDKINKVEIGDKIVTYNKNTSELSTLTIVGLDIVYDEVVGYNIDISPSDLFLVDITNDLFAIQHNVNCAYCGWFGCGQLQCEYNCPTCGGPQKV